MSRSVDIQEDLEAASGAEVMTIPLLPLQLSQNAPDGLEDTPVRPVLRKKRVRQDTQEDWFSSRSESPTGSACSTPIHNTCPAIWKAVKKRDMTAVKRVLAERPHLASCSVLHWCVRNYSFEQYETTPKVEMAIFTSILDTVDTSRRYVVLNCLEHMACDIRTTLLWQAIYRGRLGVVRALLDRGADVITLTDTKETALHASAKHPHILKLFLDNYKIENCSDSDGYAPIHWAARYDEVESVKLLLERFGDEQLAWCTNRAETPWHKIAEHDSIKVAEFMVQSKHLRGLTMNNIDGETPLYLSARHGHNALTAMVLRTGVTHLSDKANDGKSIVAQIVKHFNAPSEFFEKTFDAFIYEENRFICVDYYFLANYKDTSVNQIDVIKEMVKWGQSKILLHPLVESLLCSKWQTLLPVFYAMLVIYFTFLISFNVYLVKVFYKSDRNATFCSESKSSTDESCLACYNDWSAWVLLVFIYLSICVMIAQETIHIKRLQKLSYFRHLESWMKFSVFGLGLAVPLLVRCVSPDSSSWPRHVACAALLLAWLQAMLLLSRFPGWGYYVLMLERVAINVLKVLATAVCMVVGFSLCFMIQYHSQPPFDGPASAFVKTLVMMSSEFDFEDLFNDHDELNDTKAVVLFLFVIFVILIAIVVMNFMIAVAVSDVNELTVIGNMRRLEKQVELLSNLEVIGDTVLGQLWQRLSGVRYYYCITNSLEHNTKWRLVFKSRNEVDYDYQTLPPKLKVALRNTVNKKLGVEKQEKLEQDKNNSLKSLYDAIVGLRKTNEVKANEAKPNETQILNENIKSYIDECASVRREFHQKVDDLDVLLKDVNLKLAAIAEILSSEAKE